MNDSPFAPPAIEIIRSKRPSFKIAMGFFCATVITVPGTAITSAAGSTTSAVASHVIVPAAFGRMAGRSGVTAAATSGTTAPIDATSGAIEAVREIAGTDPARSPSKRA